MKEGEYVLQATHDKMGSAEMIVALAEKQDVGDITLSTKKPESTIAEKPSNPEPKRDEVSGTYFCYSSSNSGSNG